MQDKKVKISLVMATYNGEKYIIEQMDSIKNQTRPADEIIIADDCSTDSTVDIIKKYIAENNLSSTWHLVVNPVNKGWQKNFIDLISMATGDIIFLSDQDDICLPNKFERMTDALLETPTATLLACSPDTHYDRKPYSFERFHNFENSPYGKHTIEKVNFDRLWPQCRRPGCCYCFKRELTFIASQLWFETCPHDLLLWGIALAKDQVYILNERLHYFCRHDGNNSPNNEKKLYQRIKILNWYIAIADAILQHKNELIITSDVVKKIKRQRNFYATRVKAMTDKNIFLLLFLFTKIHLYPKYFVSWVADIISTFR